MTGASAFAPDPVLAEALGCIDAGDDDRARALLDRGLARDSDPDRCALAHAALGELALRGGDPALAARHLGIALTSGNPSLQPLLRLLRARWALRQAQAAAAASRAAAGP